MSPLETAESILRSGNESEIMLDTQWLHVKKITKILQRKQNKLTSQNDIDRHVIEPSTELSFDTEFISNLQ